MAVLNYKQVSTADNILDKIQANSAEVFNLLSQKQIIFGVLLTDITLSTSATLVPHTLTSPVTGYIVVKADVAGNVFDEESTNTMRGLFVKLLASTTMKVSLWVF